MYIKKSELFFGPKTKKKATHFASSHLLKSTRELESLNFEIKREFLAGNLINFRGKT